MVIMGYPHDLGMEPILGHASVLRAKRLTKGKEPTSQVLVTLMGEPIPEFDLKPWGTFSARSYVPKPVRCFKCQG